MGNVNNGLTYHWVKDVTVCPNGNIFAGTSNGGGVFRSTNDGDLWTQVNNGLPLSSIENLEFDSVHNQLLAGSTSGRIFRTTNNGELWEVITVGDRTIDAIAVTQAGEIIIGTIAGGIYKSIDNLNTFIQINNGILAPYDIRDLAVNSKNEIFAASVYNGIYRSTNLGEDWVQINNGLTAQHVLSLQFDFKGVLYAGAFGGVFFSNNNGDLWLQTEGLTDTYVRDLCIGNDSTVYAGTVFGGVCRNRDSTATTVGEIIAAASGYMLQNYPNPFNPETRISYSIPEQSIVSVKIFNIMGQEIAELVNEYKPAGSYHLTWDASGYSSGIYLCRLQSGTFTGVKKMILMK